MPKKMPFLPVKVLLMLLLIGSGCHLIIGDSTTDAEVPVVDSTTVPTEKTAVLRTEVYVWVDKLRLRSEANTKSETLQQLAEGTALKFLDERSDFTEKINLRGTLYDEPWLKVETPDGTVGWVYGGGVKFYKIGVDAAPTPYEDCFKLERNRRFTQAAKCLERTRFRELKKEQSRVAETDNGVRLQLLSGENLDLENVGQDTVYTFQYYLKKMGQFVVKVDHQRAGADYLLVDDKTGSTVRVAGFPKAAPDQEHIAALQPDWRDEGSFTGVQLVGYVNNQLQVVFEKPLPDFRPALPKWVDGQTLQFVVLEKKDKNLRKSRHGQLTRTADGNWELDY